MIGRRGFIGGLIGLVAAPAIVQASSLMPIKAFEPIYVGNNSLLTISEITREAVRLFNTSNEFLKEIDSQYENEFGLVGAKIGTTFRVRLPDDYRVMKTVTLVGQQQIDGRLAIAAAVPLVAAKALEANVTRRFWAA